MIPPKNTKVLQNVPYVERMVSFIPIFHSSTLHFYYVTIFGPGIHETMLLCGWKKTVKESLLPARIEGVTRGVGARAVAGGRLRRSWINQVPGSVDMHGATRGVMAMCSRGRLIWGT